MNQQQDTAAVVVESNPLSSGAAPRWRRGCLALLAVCGLATAAIASLNVLLVSHPVQQKLDRDPRNAGYAMSAHYRFYVEPKTLVLDLRRVVCNILAVRGLEFGSELHEPVG